jgi:sugar fermentation stimulation protein A
MVVCIFTEPPISTYRHKRPGKILSFDEAVECRIVERLNRFVATIEIGGTPYSAWNTNTGRLLELIRPGNLGYCIRRKDKGTTTHHLIAVSKGSYAAVIDTQTQMKAFETMVHRNLLWWLRSYHIVKRNVALGNSLIDYLLESPTESLYVEVKSAVQQVGDKALYPDCPSVRGRKHIRDLMAHVDAGGNACIVFVAGLPCVKGFRPNKEVDPVIHALLQQAFASGVDVRAVGLFFDPSDGGVYSYHHDLDIDLS